MILALIFITSFGLFLIKSSLLSRPLHNSTQTHLLFLLSSFSFLLLNFWIWADCPTSSINILWWNTQLNGFSLAFILDPATILFSCVALTVTWSIIEFTQYYMSSDPNNTLFPNILILFLLFMLILVSANNLFTLFIGWEGVGILSFVLIGWWFSRSDATSAAIQAIIYNRIGDAGLILAMATSIFYYNTWNISEILFLGPNTPFNNIISLGLILAAVGKSAQFGLHAWLPSAMEGPTPVSALLHSSTMVVAGVFLLFRTSLLFPAWALQLTCLIGSLTALFAASVAFFQFDIKKIIAYSTTSQLGLMVVAVGIGAHSLALFHICTHAFFKALLFLCSGSIIHQANNEQDLRKMGNYSTLLPFTISAITIGSLALSGIPFLAGFYSKDLILEHININTLNTISITFALVATLMTSCYSARLIFYLNTQNTFIQPINPINENLTLILWPLSRLIAGALFVGWISSILLFNTSPPIIISYEKLAPLILTLGGLTLVINTISAHNLILAKLYQLFSTTWFFVNTTHFLSTSLSLINSLFGVLRTGDHGWLSLIGGRGITNITNLTTQLLNKAITGILLSYITISFIVITASLILCLTLF